MFSNMNIRTKLTLLVSIGMILLGGLTAIFSVKSSIDSLTKSRLEQLTSIRVSKENHIQDYISSLGSLITSMANSQSTKEAFLGFEKGFYSLDKDVKIDKDIKSALENHYNNEYLNKVDYEIPNGEKRKDTSTYLPKDTEGKIAQYIFIVDNKEKIGEKNNMSVNNQYDSTYMQTHAKYHETFNKYLNSYGLYDIFLVDLNGNIVYTDFKEKDFATNLDNGVYSNTGIASVYKKAKNMNSGEIAFDDFKPYEPSYNLPASFIATPIFIDNVKKGVLIYQMPIDKINNIMSFGGKYKEAGLGESGECYLVGDDYKMRNNSRFTKDITDEVIKKAGTTIGLFTVKTNSTINALQGKRDTWIIDDYRGISVLSSYSNINVFGTKWAIVAEIDEDEALASTIILRNMIIVITVVIVLIVLFIFMAVVANIIFKPLSNLQQGLLEFFAFINRESNSAKQIINNNSDEIGTMTKIINENIVNVQKGLEKDFEMIADVTNVAREISKGNYDNKIKITAHNPALNELKNIINSMLDTQYNNNKEILNTLQKYANNDYRAKVNVSSMQGIVKELIDGVNYLGESLSHLNVDNMKNGLILLEESNVLSTNVNRLTTAANQQAASLEETAASIEEITSTIKNDTQKAMKMSELAQSVKTSASSGDKLAKDTSSAMDEINDSTTSIYDSINVIDQIAFQTNILSLNAAVEAATAGESGKGFAVVAGEVRNLASRSAEAAKEIKELVEKAQIMANNGKSISDNMIKGYMDLNSKINETIELINEVALSSKEQLAGIEQINTAVAQLDEATQENARVANNTSTIAHEVSTMASKLVDEAKSKEFIGKENIKVDKKQEIDVYKPNNKIKPKNNYDNHVWDSF